MMEGSQVVGPQTDIPPIYPGEIGRYYNPSCHLCPGIIAAAPAASDCR